MNVQYPIQGINAMSLVKKCFSSSKHCVFVLLFILSNLLFFQPTKAQVQGPFDGFTCSDTCEWNDDSLDFTVPGPDTNCKATIYFKRRTCGYFNGYLQIQPTAVRIKENSACSTALMFYGDTLHNQRIDQLMKFGDRAIVAKYFNELYEERGFWFKQFANAKVYGDTNVSCEEPIEIGFIRPACRGICISYEREDSVSPINSVYGKWYNCGTGCCFINHQLCFNPFPNGSDTTIQYGYFTDGNYVRQQYIPFSTENCSSNPTPSTSCEPSTSENQIIRFKNCRSYCVDSLDLGIYGPSYYDTYGLTNSDKSKTGVFNLDEMPFISEKDISSVPDNFLLESKSNEIVIFNTSEITSIKLVSISGVELQKISVHSNRYYIPINTGSLQNGMYLLVIDTKDSIITKPIIISR